MLWLAVAVVIANARVLTMAPDAAPAKVVAAAGGKVVYVGDDLAQAKKAAGPEAELIDAGGRVVLPGFNDAHVHFGLSLTLGSDHGVDVPEGKKAAWLDAVRRASAARPDGGWLFVKTRRLPDGLSQRDLDRLLRPVCVVSAHGGLVNRRGAERAGLSDEEAPRGQVRGRELAATLERIVKAYPVGRLRQAARAFVKRLAREGITSVQLIDELPELFEELRQAGELTVRVRMVPHGYRADTAFYQSSWQSPDPAWLRVEGVKYFHDDGARLSRFELGEIFERALADRHQVVVHVLSRHALDTLLDEIERRATAAGKPEAVRLFRIEHADEVTAQQAQRLARLGIPVCANPSMIPEWRSERAFPLRTLLDAGVALCIGSDWVGEHVPPRPLSPVAGLALAVTRGGLGEAERIEPLEALRAYTVGSAAAEGRAGDKGTLQVGRLADLIVLSDDPLAVDPGRLGELEVLLTMAGGRIVHRSGALEARPPSLPPPTIGPQRPKPPVIGPPRKPR